nr:MAG TPA: hypothetical protein [Caudoviricetes sp.]
MFLHLPIKLILRKFTIGYHCCGSLLVCLHIICIRFPFGNICIWCLSDNFCYIRSSFC